MGRLVGHRPIDPATGAATAAADQVQVCVDTAAAALDPARWELIVAEDRPRAMAGTGVDAVICARRDFPDVALRIARSNGYRLRLNGAGSVSGLLQIQDDLQSIVNAAELGDREHAHAVSESLGINCSDLFAQHPGLLPCNDDLGAKRGRARRSRSGNHDDRVEQPEIVALHDYGIAPT
jgi:hypothetical protein